MCVRALALVVMKEDSFQARPPNASPFHAKNGIMEHFLFPGAILRALSNLKILQPNTHTLGYSLWSNLAGKFAAVIANSELLFLHFTTTLTHTQTVLSLNLQIFPALKLLCYLPFFTSSWCCWLISERSRCLFHTTHSSASDTHTPRSLGRT